MTFLTAISICTAGAKVKVYDVEVNSKFFNKCDKLFGHLLCHYQWKA